MTMKRRLKLNMSGSEKGFGIVNALIGVALISITGAAILGIIKISYELKLLHQHHQTLQAFRDQLYGTFKSPLAMELTIADTDNTSMECLRNSAIPCSGIFNASFDAPLYYAKGPFKLRDTYGGVVFNSLVTTNGFQQDGELCTGFNATTGNSICPFKIELTWLVKCVNPCGAALSPQIQVTAKFSHNPGVTDRSFAFNPAWYDITLLIPPVRANRDAHSIKFTDDDNEVTWKVPPNVTQIYVQVWGGGGGGGGGRAFGAGSYIETNTPGSLAVDHAPSQQFRTLSGGGGGGGAYAASVITVIPENDITIHVGAGGAGGDYNNGDASKRPGRAGEDSWIRMGAVPLIRAAGGKGGHFCSTIPCIAPYGLGGKGGARANSIGRLISEGSDGGNYNEQVDRVLDNKTSNATLDGRSHEWRVSRSGSWPTGGSVQVRIEAWTTLPLPAGAPTVQLFTPLISWPTKGGNKFRRFVERISDAIRDTWGLTKGKSLDTNGTRMIDTEERIVHPGLFSVPTLLNGLEYDDDDDDDVAPQIFIADREPPGRPETIASQTTAVYINNLFGGRGGNGAGGGGQGGLNDFQNASVRAPSVPGGGGTGKGGNTGGNGARGTITIQW